MRLTTAILSLVLVSGSLVAYAGEGKGRDHLTRMKTELNLSDEQVAEMRQIREAGGSREEVHAVLTDEQRAKVQQMRQKHSKRSDEKLKRMQQHLGLTDDQVAEMRKVREQGGSREDMDAVLTDEQRAQLEQMRNMHGGGHGKGKGKRSQSESE